MSSKISIKTSITTPELARAVLGLVSAVAVFRLSHLPKRRQHDVRVLFFYLLLLMALIAASKAHAANSVVICDFNSDGYADEAYGSAYEDIATAWGTARNAGAVNVIYGSAGGLSAEGNQFLYQGRAGILGGAQTNDYFGRALSCGDYDNDGFADLAVGVPGENEGRGAVHIIYGSAGGLTAAGNKIWSQKHLVYRQRGEKYDGFGSALSSGDFNNDGFDDLAVGAAGKDIKDNWKNWFASVVYWNAGAVYIIRGSRDGLSEVGSRIWTQANVYLAKSVWGSKAEDGDLFGAALSSGDYNNDGYDDLAIGVPGDNVNKIRGGSVTVFSGSKNGLIDVGVHVWHQDRPGIISSVEAGDGFGGALSSCDFNNDGYDDLAIGVSREDVYDIKSAGAVNVIYGSAGRLTAAGSQIWHQNSPGIRGGAEAYDVFGRALSCADYNQDGFADLAVGVEGEDIGNIKSAGAVNIIYGSLVGLSADGNQIWHQDSRGVAGGAENYDHFGQSLASGDVDGDGFADIAIGVGGEDIGNVPDACMTTSLYGSVYGLSATRNDIWHQDMPGIRGRVEAYDCSYGPVIIY